ncbi:MAG: ATP synthase F1 subunit gamma [Fidelibacterota bacterium]
MANLKDIRNRIKSVKSIQQVTKAMKMVAAAKMRKAQERMEQARPYTKKLHGMILSLLPDIDRSLLPLLDIRPVRRTAVVVITSDRGLAGSFNTNLIKQAQALIDERGKENVDLICIGKKGRDFFRRRGYTITAEYIDFWSELDFNLATKISQGIISHFTQGLVDEILVAYNEFVNVAVQEIIIEKLLPLSYEEDQPVPSAGERLYEPSRDDIVVSLVPRHVNVQVWQYLLESYASEQAARMVAMENATSNAADMIKALQLQYNKARQASITTEMLEIVSGAEALT